MVKIENTVTPSDAWWEAVVRGARNPYSSWEKSDSYYKAGYHAPVFSMGDKDFELLRRLANAGDDHGKFMRMLPVLCDLTAPFHLWKQIDQYKVGTVTDSCSTMHTIMSKPFEVDDFSWEHTPDNVQDEILSHLNILRRQYLAEEDSAKKKEVWNELIEFLPESYNQKRTWLTNYQVLKHIFNARKGHKLKDWETIRSWIESLPYSELITGNASDGIDA